MKCLQQLRFLKRFPGPYDYRRGVDGVDDTFNVNCVTTGRYIISTYFWEEVQRCEEITCVVTSALNRQADWHGFIPQTFDGLWAKFRSSFPGPYDVSRDCCPGKGDFLDVYCTTSGESVIQSYGIGADSKLIAKQIVASLNDLGEDTLTSSY